MGMNGNRLVDQLETTFRVADRLDGKCPPGSGLVGDQAYVDSQPLVGHAEVVRLVQVQFCLQLSQALLLAVIIESIVGMGWETSKIEFDAKMQRSVLRQPFQQVGDFQSRTARFGCHAFGQLDGDPIHVAVACQQYLDAVRVPADRVS